MPRSRHSAFTLIELLVVITIIVVLLALLTPALDKAMYQAKLVACGAQQDLMGSGALRYAFENRRSYFHRPGVINQPGNWRPWSLRLYMSAVEDYDDRIITEAFIPLEAFKDPLAGDVDISEGGTESDVNIHASYNLLFGFKYTMWRGMMRMGDRLRFRDSQFNLLTGDLLNYEKASFVESSHPDRSQLLGLTELQNWRSTGGIWGNFTFTRWQGGTWEHGNLDMNYGYQDGSVRRINDLKAIPSEVIENPTQHGDTPLRMMGSIAGEGDTAFSPGRQAWSPGN